MVLFDELKASRNEKIDLIRMALSNYSSPYKVSGYDAVTLNNLTEFISNNIIYKKRKDYSENDLSNLMYKYAYRYFTQFVTPSATLDIIEMMILYNKYMTFNIGENAMSNVFGISEKFKYSVTLIDDPLNINQDSSRTYSFSVPYIANEYRDNLDITFRLNSNQFNIVGKIINIDKSPDGFILSTDFELQILDGISQNIEYDLLSNGLKVAKVKLDIFEPREYIVDKYASNLMDNMISDFSNIINNMYIADSSVPWLTTNLIITETVSKDAALTSKKNQLISDLEKIKTDGVLREVIIGMISEYCQNTTVTYNNPVTGINLSVSKLTQDIAKHINKEINHTGIGLDELYIIFKNSVNTYEAALDSNRETEVLANIAILEEFFNNLFR